MDRTKKRSASRTADNASSSDHHEDPETSPSQYVHCVVTLAHRHVKLRVSALDTVGSLVELAKAKLHKKYPYEEFAGAVVGVRSARLDRGMAATMGSTGWISYLSSL